MGKTRRVVQHWNRLSREAVEPLSLDVSKTQIDKTMVDLI